MQLVVDKFETLHGVVIQPEAGPITDEQFFAQCERYPDYRIETSADGDVIIMPPTHPRTGNRNFWINTQLGVWAGQNGRGEGFDSSTGFFLPNGARRSADCAWVSKERLGALSDDDALWHTTPEFVIELGSGSDRLRTLRAKMQEWIANGVSLAWLIDPEERTVEIYRAGAAPEVLTEPAEVVGEGPVAGFVLKMARVW
jgi:Uma2 family endonuclease